MARDIRSKAQRDQQKPVRFLAYALPRNERDREARRHQVDGIEIHDVPLGSNESFLDYDGIILCAGTFEGPNHSGYGSPLACLWPADLDRREREFFTCFFQGKTIIYLLPNIPSKIDQWEIRSSCDLFRSVAVKLGLHWHSQARPNQFVESIVPEFRDYVGKFGTGYLRLDQDNETEGWMKPLCKAEQQIFGAVLGGRLFLLPSVTVQNSEQVVQIVTTAVPATLTYRERVSKELPEWLMEFQFGNESGLRIQTNSLYEQVTRAEAQIDAYGEHKGCLAYQSDPLVVAVRKVLDHFCGIKLIIDEKFIEDGTMRSDMGAIEAVFEIKGVKGNFARTNVNQIDSHRERLGLQADTHGVLIMNTFIDASSLKEKDQCPHPDIVKKAVSDHVLLIRTLDLLRYADAVERTIFGPDSLRKLVLSESGWLKVENDIAEVLKE